MSRFSSLLISSLCVEQHAIQQKSSVLLPESFVPLGNAEGKSEQRLSRLTTKVLECNEEDECRERSVQTNTQKKTLCLFLLVFSITMLIIFDLMYFIPLTQQVLN